MKKIFILLALVCLNIAVIHSKGAKPKRLNGKKVFVSTIPKSGTYLLLKCLALCDIKGVSYKKTPFNPGDIVASRAKKHPLVPPPNDYKGKFHVPTVGPSPKWLVRALNKHLRGAEAIYDHWPYTKESAIFLDKKTDANLFLLRDPRDQLVSMAFFLQDGGPGLHEDPKNLMMDFIDGRKKSFVPWGVYINDAYPLMYELGVCDFYKLYLPWTKIGKFLTVKFENLVGPQGGGSKEAQLQEVKNIMRHLKFDMPDEKLATLVDNLFGGSSTFRDGQIGSWKKHFTPEMKEAFKKVPGACQLLIDLGYEKDSNW